MIDMMTEERLWTGYNELMKEWTKQDLIIYILHRVYQVETDEIKRLLDRKLFENL